MIIYRFFKKRHKPIRKKESWSGDNSNTILKVGKEMGEQNSLSRFKRREPKPAVGKGGKQPRYNTELSYTQEQWHQVPLQERINVGL